jgi:hypothetical protein
MRPSVPVEGVWANMKNGLGNLAAGNAGQRAAVVRNRLERIPVPARAHQWVPYQSGLTDDHPCIADSVLIACGLGVLLGAPINGFGILGLCRRTPVPGRRMARKRENPVPGGRGAGSPPLAGRSAGPGCLGPGCAIRASALSGGCPGRSLLGVCDGVHPPLPGHALQFLDAVIVEGDSGTGDQVFYRL